MATQMGQTAGARLPACASATCSASDGASRLPLAAGQSGQTKTTRLRPPRGGAGGAEGAAALASAAAPSRACLQTSAWARALLSTTAVPQVQETRVEARRSDTAASVTGAPSSVRQMGQEGRDAKRSVQACRHGWQKTCVHCREVSRRAKRGAR